MREKKIGWPKLEWKGEKVEGRTNKGLRESEKKESMETRNGRQSRDSTKLKKLRKREIEKEKLESRNFKNSRARKGEIWRMQGRNRK